MKTFILITSHVLAGLALAAIIWLMFNHGVLLMTAIEVLCAIVVSVTIIHAISIPIGALLERFLE
jgi:hypothetical protein